MKILRLALKGYKRFALVSDKEIDVVLNGRLVLIIGTNGSGKSSLIRELSPLPAVSTDYHKNGSKLIEISSNGNSYTLRSSFESSNSFSFICNDEELNPGHTVTVYKDLVYKHFRINSNIHSLLCNDSSFIYYSTQERKQWITYISNNDLTFAISYYNKCRETLRDLTGSVKMSKVKLLQETAKLINTEEHLELKSIIESGNTLIDKLLDHRDNRSIDPNKVKDTINHIERDIRTIVSQLETEIGRYPNDRNLASMDSIDRLQEQLLLDSSSVATYKEITKNSLCRVRDNITILKKANVSTRDNMVLKLSTMNKKLTDLNRQLTLPIEYESIEDAISAYNVIRDTLEHIAVNLLEDPNKDYSEQGYLNRMDTYSKLTKNILNLEDMLRASTSKKKQLEVQRKESNVVCPMCTHEWHLNFSEQEYIGIVSSVKEADDRLHEYRKQHESINDELNAYRVQLNYFKTYKDLCSKSRALIPLWNYINDKGLLYTDPRKLLSILDSTRHDLKIHIEIKKTTKELNELKDAVDLLDKDADASLATLNDKYEELNGSLYEYNKESERLRTALENLKQYKATLTRIDAAKGTLKRLIEAYKDSIDTAVTYKRKQSIDEIIKTVKMYIVDKENMLAKQEVQIAIVDNIQKTIDSQEESLEYYKAIEKAMSPSEGLIARSLTGFINVFVKQVNAFIKKIWSYPLELLEIEPNESIDVNYKFSVLVNDDAVISDIVKLSSAQKEIVDLAIRIVSMKYLNMDDYPLYLDEFSRSMDVNHRKNSFYAINQLAMSSNYSQIFLVSHYKELYDGLKNTQIIELST